MDVKIPLKDIMKRNIAKVDIKSDVQHLTKKMLDCDVGSIVITDKMQPVGIVTKRDIFKKVVSNNLRPADISIKELMTTPLITIPATEDTKDALHKMVQNSIRRLIVVENDKLVGIVTDTDLKKQLERASSIGESLLHDRLPGVPTRYPGSERLPGVTTRYPGSKDSSKGKKSDKSKESK